MALTGAHIVSSAVLDAVAEPAAGRPALPPPSSLAMLEAHRRDQLMEAVAAAAKELLGPSDFIAALHKVAEQIGTATGVDRAHIFILDGELGNIEEHVLWAAPGLYTPEEFRAPQRPMSEAGLHSWIPRLNRGDVIAGHVRDFVSPVRDLLEVGGLLSVLCVPVFADGQWRGAIGLDDCRNERDWSASEIGAIKTLAELVGAAFTTHRQQEILGTVTDSARELLRSADLQQSLPGVMERIGKAVGVDRVHVFEFKGKEASVQSNAVQHYVWSAPGIRAPLDLRSAQGPLTGQGLDSWVSRLKRGKIIVGDSRDFNPLVRAFLERYDVRSVLAVPVFVDGCWRGLMSFEACREERHWTATEIETFKAIAEFIGSAVARMLHLTQLADANHIIDGSSTVLYRLEPQPPYGLSFISQNAKRFGYEPDELTGTSTHWQSLVHPGDLPGVMANIRRIAAGESDAAGIEFRFRAPDGSWIWLVDDGRALRDAQGTVIAIEGLLTDVTERKLASRRRDAILQAVAASANALLRSSDLEQSLSKVLEWIGKATGVDRVHIFEVDSANPARPIVRHHMWSTPEARTVPYLPPIEAFDLAEAGFSSWLPRLEKGEAIVGHVREFEEPVRKFFEAVGTRSVLTVPVRVDGHWWGHLGFDDCRNDRDWSSAEIDTLKTLAELVGAAVARTAQVKTLADANRIVENSPTILYRLSPQAPFSLIYLSQNARRYGHEAEQLVAAPNGWLQLFDAAYHPAILADIKSIVEGRTEQTLLELPLRKPDGTQVWFEGRGYAVRDQHGRLTAIEGVLADITERKIASERIAALARTDSLTGLANRAALLDRLRLEFARARRAGEHFALHYLDLDHFKDVNDTLGHPVGDQLLCAVADRLRACVRETDMIARFGGDEFAILQSDIGETIEDIEALAVKIGAALSAPFALGTNQVRTSASIGIVPYRSDIAGTDAMMMKADLALYRAKNEGRNQFRFHVAELDERTRERMILGEELRHAIARDEFELFYQPQVDLKSGEVVGLEALIRWNHPKRGLLLPGIFIPIAETTGSIVPMGEWLIEQACRQIRTWTDQQIAPPTVAVNISGAQFKLASQLDKIVRENLARFSIAPEHLELELTESVMIETTRRHGETFQRLRSLGVRLAIDDFGTGYSSLDYLRAFRVSRLKIDQRFIADVETSADDAAIVRAAIGLANELGMSVVAEGVETAGQRDFLLGAGCAFGQGHYFGKPMPVDEATALLRVARAEAGGIA